MTGNTPLTPDTAQDAEKPPASARRQVKFSGLVNAGVISPTPDINSPPHFANTLSGAAAPQQLQPLADRPVAALTIDATQKAEWELVENESVRLIDVDMVDDSPFQPEDEARDRYNSEGIDDLAHTMASAGQKENIIVRVVNGRFELIAGHRRIRAARSLGWAKIKALVVGMKDDLEAEKSVMVHNEGTQGNSDYAKAKLYQRAKQRGFAKTQADIAHMFATKQASVSKRLAMLELPTPILNLLESQFDLFGMNASAAIHELLAELPSETDLITKAVARIKHENAKENSIRGWVLQMVQSRTKLLSGKPGKTKPKVITDPAGRQLYTAKLEGRVITFRVSAAELDPSVTLDAMVEYFQAAAKGKSKE
ncbi:MULTISPECIES: ParB/RepB/Spo0J family partition protein [unclassified Janthinobacterium]|uniref:ParB/RepB/Spo0J family partition protein n=1 Tax=unclassified Janthinobacterium TaxID=2610881 RepID=UPI00161B012B|nr:MULTISPECIES: ParB/RepB/Spo0J family partition protein [unclassified Janthinobacterium]MBB5610576.1 ParB/RepB/Spo0J family partition protein [Janthinobacterium sp. S3T4]MBB5615970.1 ParB/RepB/Spo0J family partition protein [Janthinobacterium sp. S3M3]